METVIKTTLSNFQNNFDQLMDRVAKENIALLIERDDGKNAVIVSPERWREYEENSRHMNPR
jgi:PHD/YefM family antitoxin component YafN of YafNO toxin-antitoxin module